MCRALCSVDCTFYQTAEGALHLFHFYFHFSMAMYHHQCASSGWCICRWTCWFSHVWYTKLADFPIIRSVGACSRDHLLTIRWSFPQIFPFQIWLTRKWLLGVFCKEKLRKDNLCREKASLGQLLWTLNCPGANFPQFSTFSSFPACFARLVFFTRNCHCLGSAGRRRCFKSANNKIWNLPAYNIFVNTSAVWCTFSSRLTLFHRECESSWFLAKLVPNSMWASSQSSEMR